MTVRTFDYLYRNQHRGKGNPKNPPTVSAQFQVCPLLLAFFFDIDDKLNRGMFSLVVRALVC